MPEHRALRLKRGRNFIVSFLSSSSHIHQASQADCAIFTSPRWNAAMSLPCSNGLSCIVDQLSSNNIHYTPLRRPCGTQELKIRISDQNLNGQTAHNHSSHLPPTAQVANANNTTMTASLPPSQATLPPHRDHKLLIGFLLLILASFLSIYTYSTCQNQDETHSQCPPTKTLTLSTSFLLAYLAAIALYTSEHGRLLFPLVAACYFGVVMLAGFESLRAAWAVVLGAEVVVLGAFVASKRCWARPRGGNGDGVEEALVGEVESG